MMQQIEFRYKGKYVRLMHHQASENIEWFAYGTNMPCKQIADFWSVLLMDQITEHIDAYLEEQEYAS